MNMLYGIPIILFLGGCALRYWVGRRRFYRRNSFGIEEFSNYERSKLTHLLEELLTFIAIFLIIAALLLTAMVYSLMHSQRM